MRTVAVTKRMKESQRKCLMLAKHFTLKMLSKIFHNTERAQDKMSRADQNLSRHRKDVLHT